jgi:hypothetical protein
MKKIVIVGFLCTLGFLTSCDKELLEPFTPGVLTEDKLTTSADMQRVLNSAYANFINRTDIVYSSVMTDEIGIGFANGGQGINSEFVFFQNAASGSANAIWNSCYFALARANRVITFADDIVPTSPGDAILLRRQKAEALVLRAMAHIKILSYFSTDPKSDTALAGVLSASIIRVSDPAAQRVSNQVFYTQIHKDLDDAIALFDGVIFPAGSVAPALPYAANVVSSYPSKNLAKAMKARAYGLKGDYVNAEIWANDVIATSGISLATAAQYNAVFHTDSEPAGVEVIFRFKRTLQNSAQGTNLGNGYASVDTTVNGSAFYEIGRSLFNVLNATPLDVRRSTIVHPSSIIDPNYATSANFRTTDQLILGKHRGTAGTGALNSDFKICRIAEMFFLRAEARAAAGDLAGAATAIKAVLDRRFTAAQPLPVYNNPTAAWKAILDQRRIEFAFEGYRFIDLKRIGALAGVTGVDRDPADYASSTNNFPDANPVNFPLTSTKFALPIPLDEKNANPAIQQNPGY